MLKDRGPFRRACLKGYVSSKGHDNSHVVFDDYVAEILEQQGFRWEEKPRSLYRVDDLWTALARFAEDWDQYEGNDEALRYGFRKAFAIYGKPKTMRYLTVLDDQELIHGALKLDKSAGLPLLGKKKDSLVYSLDREQQILKGIKAPNPVLAGARTSKPTETRLVWGYPLEMVCMEGRFARPLIDTFLIRPTPMAFGMSKCELGARLDRYYSEQPGTTVCLDYSKFDSTISRYCISRAFRILSSWFSPEDRASHGWDTIVKYFIFTPIVMPDGHLYTGKRHGVPSGSYFTQMIDSIVNTAMCYALRYRGLLRFKPHQLMVLGDDVIVQTTLPVDLGKMAEYVSHFGLRLHDDEKTIVGEVHFLGAYWHKGKPDLPLNKVTTKAVYPEKWRNYHGHGHAGAKEVLFNYSTAFKSAYKLLPFHKDIRMYDFPETNHEDVSYLPGLQRFLEQERGPLVRVLKTGIPSASVRFLL
jgi:hypothetical protein